jgi:hypothetical protein
MDNVQNCDSYISIPSSEANKPCQCLRSTKLYITHISYLTGNTAVPITKPSCLMGLSDIVAIGFEFLTVVAMSIIFINVR